MTTHELILLSPYRFPAGSPLNLANEDMAAWLNGFTVLWHPALIWQAQGPPRCENPYDHEVPKPGCIYVVPESPPSYMPDDWEERVRQAGSIAFKSSVDRESTLQNMLAAFEKVSSPTSTVEDAAAPQEGVSDSPIDEPTAEAPSEPSAKEESTAPPRESTDPTSAGPALGWAQGASLTGDDVAPFYGIGWGHLLLTALGEAMEHELVLDVAGFWADVQAAVTRLAGFQETEPTQLTPSPTETFDGTRDDPPVGEPEPPREELSPGFLEDANVEDSPIGSTHGNVPTSSFSETDWRESLKAAAGKLQSAREILYPVTIHLLDLHLSEKVSEPASWRQSVEAGVSVNVMASTASLEAWAEHVPGEFDLLKKAVTNDRAEVIGGSYMEREDVLLPVDSQLWNLRQGLARARELLGSEVRVFGRQRFGYSPQTPLLLATHGLNRAVSLVFDDTSGLPHHQSMVIGWPSPDGKHVDAFVRAPKPADSSETYFNLGNTWFRTTRDDHTATVCLVHGREPTAIWHRDLVELAKLGDLLGTWETFSRYFTSAMAGEFPPTPTADDFHHDFLSERIERKSARPVSAFALHMRRRRRVSALWTYAALLRGIAGKSDTLDVHDELRALETDLERKQADAEPPEALDALETRVLSALASRLQARAQDGKPGWMLINPCGFARRIAVELEGATHALPIEGPVKACQLDGNVLRAVVEAPALGFLWIPRSGPPGVKPAATKVRMADATTSTIRNEFIEVEIDPATGGLKALRDQRTQLNRVGQQLVFNPGSKAVASSVQVTSSGPALAEIVSEGTLVGEQQQVIAKFRQRFRVWMGRPLLEMRIEIEPVQPAAGYAWHAYFGARFAWRDERMPLIRGVGGAGYITQHPRPQTGDYLEVRAGPANTVLFTGGLPFHLKQGGRMVDVILVPEGETERVFDLAISIDREQPMQTALGYVSPIGVLPTSKGPPHIGAQGWLFHVDAPNLLLTQLMPGRLAPRRSQDSYDSYGSTGSVEGELPSGAAPPAEAQSTSTPEMPTSAPNGNQLKGADDAVTARFLEIAGASGFAEFRCARNPIRAEVLNAVGQFQISLGVEGDVVRLEVSPNDLVHVQVEFSEPD